MEAGTYTIVDITHPEYDLWVLDWYKWRMTYLGGFPFIQRFLQQYSERESPNDFDRRKQLSYNPAYAKESINEIKNSIFQRAVDIQRLKGPESYQRAVEGLDGGVDLRGSKMNEFIGRSILPDLLVMQKVGVFIDMPQIPGPTLLDKKGKRPYLYLYPAEDIRSWSYDTPGNENDFRQVLLADHIYASDGMYGLPLLKVDRYRYFYIGPDGYVYLKYFNQQGAEIDLAGNVINHNETPGPDGSVTPGIKLELTRIPFVVFEIPHSLMKDVADMQIALLNLASSDLEYVRRANFPFYTEQYDSHIEPNYSKPPGQLTNPGDTVSVDTSRPTEIQVGISQGRRYPIGAERPQFIHPSSEPLMASMKLQDQIKKDIRHLVHLSVADLDPQMASAESKGKDDEGLESGLSFIGLVLERGERKIAEHWARYENAKNPQPATVTYPKNYSLISEAERRKEAEELETLMEATPSNTYKREIAKRIAKILLSNKITYDTLQQIFKEIDSAPTIVSDPKDIALDIQNGLVSDETASLARGYPKGEVEQAKKDRADKIRLTLEAQGGPQGTGGQARGAPEFQTTQPSSVAEKAGKPQRGEQVKP